MRTFCEVLESPSTAGSAYGRLERSGALTGWAWTHPTMSVLLRRHGSSAMVLNPPGQWEPFDADAPPAIDYPGACESRRFTNASLLPGRWIH
jgi:hypothetical protein